MIICEGDIAERVEISMIGKWSDTECLIVSEIAEVMVLFRFCARNIVDKQISELCQSTRIGDLQ